jgi:hypothetical protein
MPSREAMFTIIMVAWLKEWWNLIHTWQENLKIPLFMASVPPI